MTPQMWAKLRARSETEVQAGIAADPDAATGRLGPAGRVALVKRIRWKLGLSQTEFAERFQIPVGTLRDWEQHRREPDQAARAYLRVIDAEPDTVQRVLDKSPA